MNSGAATIRANCSICGRYVATRIPKGGTGDYRTPYKHHNYLGKPCDGHLYGALGWGFEGAS